MDYYNRLHYLKGMISQNSLGASKLTVADANAQISQIDIDCLTNHLSSLTKADTLFRNGSYEKCIILCQQQLHCSKDFSPRKTRQYLIHRQRLSRDVRDSAVPDYFKCWYMMYQVYSNVKLRRFLFATSECVHAIVLLEAIVARAEWEEDYIASYTVQKRDKLLQLLRIQLQKFVSVYVRSFLLIFMQKISFDLYSMIFLVFGEHRKLPQQPSILARHSITCLRLDAHFIKRLL